MHFRRSLASELKRSEHGASSRWKAFFHALSVAVIFLHARQEVTKLAPNDRRDVLEMVAADPSGLGSNPAAGDIDVVERP